MRHWQRAWRLEQQADWQAGRKLRKQMQTMPSCDPHDPGYRRLRYCRYADDWLLGFAGPRQEAEQIKACIGAFLHDQLALELSATKTLITHGRTQPARFSAMRSWFCTPTTSTTIAAGAASTLRSG
jgi:hypothetical protein